MLDLDGLKPINDRFGHYFGDRMLQAVAEAVRQGIRVIDTAARYGGDEFVVLLPETDTEGASVVAEKLRRSVAAIRLNAGTDVLSSTISIGVVAFPDDGRTADALTNRADQVMYGAKRAGRDRVSVEGHDGAPAVGRRGTRSTAVVAADRGSAMPGGSAPCRHPPASGSWRRPVAASASGQPRERGRSGPRTARASRATASRPSMFTESYPSLPPWSPATAGIVDLERRADGSSRSAGGGDDAVGHGRRPGGDADPAPADIASSRDVVSPSASSRTPTTRARRFLVDHPDDRTFERTMRHFLPGKGDPPPTAGAVDRDDPGG